MNIVCSMTVREMHDAKQILEDNGVKSIVVNFSKFVFGERPYTEEEKKETDNKFLLGYNGLCKNKGVEELTHTCMNPNFKEECVAEMKRICEEYKDEDIVIFINFNAFALKYLEENGIWYTMCYPDKSMKEEMIGREFIAQLQGYNKTETKVNYRYYTNTKLLFEKWDDIITHFKDYQTTTCEKLVMFPGDRLGYVVLKMLKS